MTKLLVFVAAFLAAVSIQAVEIQSMNCNVFNIVGVSNMIYESGQDLVVNTLVSGVPIPKSYKMSSAFAETEMPSSQIFFHNINESDNNVYMLVLDSELEEGVQSYVATWGLVVPANSTNDSMNFVPVSSGQCTIDAWF